MHFGHSGIYGMTQLLVSEAGVCVVYASASSAAEAVAAIIMACYSNDFTQESLDFVATNAV